MLEAEISEAQARAAHCWFDGDRVSKDPATTTWKRRARLHQAAWREERGFPIGAEPYTGGPSSRHVGSRLALDYAMSTGANFLTPAAHEAARTRLANPERGQTLRPDRLWADLLSSMPLCFNLFGELSADSARAVQAIEAWWPGIPIGRVTVRFEHSPGRREREYLGNKSAFDAAFEIESASGAAIIGVETKYHEHAKRESAPTAVALARYVEVTERSAMFASGWYEKLVGTDLQQIWFDHLLVLAMLQHPSKRWTSGRFVLVYPSDNPSFASAAERYRAVLEDPSTTFEARTIEGLLGVDGVLSDANRDALRARYALRC